LVALLFELSNIGQWAKDEPVSGFWMRFWLGLRYDGMVDTYPKQETPWVRLGWVFLWDGMVDYFNFTFNFDNALNLKQTVHGRKTWSAWVFDRMEFGWLHPRNKKQLD
jgi:hypothetical protein